MARAGRPASKLSLLSGFAESFSSMPSAKSFGYEGAVGLGIVAAMGEGGGGSAAIAMTPRAALRRPSEPIPILSARSGYVGIRRTDQRSEDEEDEAADMMSESYTCVISHVEGATVRKRVYVGDASSGGGGADLWGCIAGVFIDSPPPPRPAAEDFLSRCFRCRKALHGIDIFIYRGEKAFCSEECRRRLIASEEQGCSKYILDSPATLDRSASPCSASLPFAAGLAAA